MYFPVFCTYCWRPVLAEGKRSKGTKYFCGYHFNSGVTKKNNIRDKRKIFKALAKDNNEWSIAYEKYRNAELSRDSFYELTSKSFISLTTLPEIASKEVKVNNYALRKTTASLLGVVKIYYPKSYQGIEDIEEKNFNTNVDLLVLITVAFNEEQDQFYASCNYATLEMGLESARWVKFVLEVIARHESYLIAKEKGKMIGTKATDINNDELCKKIIKIMESNKQKGVKNNYRSIAEELGHTEAWIGRLANRIIKASLVK
jgi:hypothetical protein